MTCATTLNHKESQADQGNCFSKRKNITNQPATRVPQWYLAVLEDLNQNRRVQKEPTPVTSPQKHQVVFHSNCSLIFSGAHFNTVGETKQYLQGLEYTNHPATSLHSHALLFIYQQGPEEDQKKNYIQPSAF